MSTIREKIKSNKFLALVILTYLILMITMPSKAALSVKNSLYYVKEMLIIMPVILLLTSLIDAWVPRKTIENNFGKDSGLKGSIFSFLLGSFSAGPIYAAFPVCKMLLKKGAGVSNVVIILSTWAVIKIPMLANESKFLGLKFMSIRWVLTTISIFIMAYITSKIVRKDEIPTKEAKSISEENVLYINQEYCMGCGLCTKISPDNFVIVNKKATAVKQDIKSDERQAVNEAIEKCPAKVIKFIE